MATGAMQERHPDHAQNSDPSQTFPVDEALRAEVISLFRNVDAQHPLIAVLFERALVRRTSVVNSEQ